MKLTKAQTTEMVDAFNVNITNLSRPTFCVLKQIAYQQRAQTAWCCFTLQHESATIKPTSFHTQTQSEGLN